MSRYLAKLALTFALVAAAVSPAIASFAQPPPGTEVPAGRPPTREVEFRFEDPATPRLSDRVRARLRTTLAKHRAKNLRAFAGYVARGSFPHNYATPGLLNVWIDRDQHMCAAATMIYRSGARALVRQVARDQNNIRLADVTDGPLLDWILTSGLTHAEVVAIQEPFMGRGDEPRPPRPIDWKLAEDDRLRARYAEVTRQLADDRAASLDAAIDALAARPDLVARLLGARG